MKYLIVGLGNPGDKYENTRHNIGFKVLDYFLKDLDDPWSIAKQGLISKVKFKGRVLVFLKPSTFMNLSGKAVNYWMQKENIPLENVLIVTDDIALPQGKLRLKGNGSDGGHNGLKSIIEVLKVQQFARLRFGVGNEFSSGRQADYVLGEWSAEDIELMDARLEICTEFIKGFVTIGLQRTMNNWNNK